MKKLLLFIVAGLVSSLGFSQQEPQLTDPEIASVAVTANQIDVDYGQIALKKSENQEVLGFANAMIKDHTAIIDQAVALAKKLNVVPKDNAVSQSLMDGAAKKKMELQGASKEDFDKEYVDNEVAYHQAVIKTVKDVLIPQTENEELKELLQTALSILETHLKHAETVQDKIQ